MPKRVALYVHVSTNEQTTQNQQRELKAVAKRQGWEIVHIFEDAGIYGAKATHARKKAVVEAVRAFLAAYRPEGE